MQKVKFNAPKPTSKMAQLVFTAIKKRDVDSSYAVMSAIGEIQRDVSMLWPYRHAITCIAKSLNRVNPGLSTESEPNSVVCAVDALVNEAEVLRREKCKP